MQGEKIDGHLWRLPQGHWISYRHGLVETQVLPLDRQVYVSIIC